MTNRTPFIFCIFACGLTGCTDPPDDAGSIVGNIPLADVACTSAQDGTWSRYGSTLDSAHCIKDSAFRDASNVSGLALAWEKNLPMGSTSTPAVADGIAYFGDWSGIGYAVDVKSGSELGTTNLSMIRGIPVQIHSTPLIDGDTVYVADSNAVTAVNRTSGEILWTSVVDTHPDVLLDSSPIIFGNQLFIGVSAIELTHEQPYDFTFRGSVVALDKTNGAQLWKTWLSQNDATSGAGVSVWSSASIDETRNLLYIGTGQGLEAPASPFSDSLLALDISTGAIVWQNQFTADDIYTTPVQGPGPDYDIGATPVLFRGKDGDLVGVGSKAGIFKALDRETGKLAWEVELPEASAVGGCMASPAVTSKVVYVNSNQWKDFGFFDGTQSPNDTSTTYALSADNGDILWKRKLSAPMFGALTVANGVVYQGLIDHKLVALDARTGVVLWCGDLPSSAGAGVSVAEGTLFVSYGFDFFKANNAPVEPNGVRAYR